MPQLEKHASRTDTVDNTLTGIMPMVNEIGFHPCDGS